MNLKNNNQKTPLICSICGQDIKPQANGWDQGHNAKPINNGRCCDDCNNLVISRRIQDFYRRAKQPLR